MSEEKPPLTAADLEKFVALLQDANAKAMNALLTVSHQSAASSLIEALLVRELGNAGLIDRDRLRAEALARAQEIGPGVVAVVENVFGGKPPVVVKIPARAAFTVIQGGLGDGE